MATETTGTLPAVLELIARDDEDVVIELSRSKTHFTVEVRVGGVTRCLVKHVHPERLGMMVGGGITAERVG